VVYQLKMPSKKKKKKQDFQKVKLKVGRKLPRPSNETRTQFKVRGINIKSQFHSERVSGAVGSTRPCAANIKVGYVVVVYSVCILRECYLLFLKHMMHLKVFFRNWLFEATFERKLTGVSYTLAQVFAFENQLLEN